MPQPGPLPTSHDVSYRRVLIVDDSAVARAVMGRLIDASDRWVVSRAVAGVEQALAFLASDTVDAILLDVQMPGTDGLTALPSLTSAAPAARIVIVSSLSGAADQAMALGAAGTLTKPGPSSYTSQFGTAMIELLDRLFDGDRPASPAAVPFPTLPRAAPPAWACPTRTDSAQAFDIVVIGASTGGIHALNGVLRQLPASCRVPIVITQHLPGSFMPYFAAQLAVLAGRPCDVATDRMRVRPGRLIVAPGDAHLHGVALADGGTAIRLSREAVASGCMPSVDPMMSSFAVVHGSRLLAVMLSGMGRDGADGARDAHAAGGCVVVQNSESSVVWGMPGAVVAAGVADAVLTPTTIGALIASGRRPA